MGKRTGGKRGAPFGNSNRLVHGRWSKAFTEDRRAHRALIRKARHLVIRADMVTRARRAFVAARKRRAEAGDSLSQLPGGPYAVEGESSRQLTRILSMLQRIAVHDTG
jgi:hypothetical protein